MKGHDDECHGKPDDEVLLDDPLTKLDKDDLFCLQLDYEPNGNIMNKYWQVATRKLFKYNYSYDNLNRLTDANFSEHFVDNNTRKKSNENRFSVTGIGYSPEGNITALTRNGISGYCNEGIPEYGLIDALTYSYQNNRLSGISDASGSSYGYPALSPGSYTYDANGNALSDPGRGIDSIVYNYLNLPQKIITDSVTIIYVYDGSGVKWQKTYEKDTFSRTIDYFNGVEYIDEEITSVFLEEEERTIPKGEVR